ncbi:MAG: hypothetical protein J0M30_14810 [Chitinophagales bacterium]|nr:hypothetical protein [Chitinophagales bacterium]
MTQEVKKFFKDHPQALFAFVVAGMAFATIEEANDFAKGSSEKPNKVSKEGLILEGDHAQIESLTKELESAKAVISGHEAENNALKAELEKYSGREGYDEKQRQVEELKGQLEAVTKERDSLRAQAIKVPEDPKEGKPANTSGKGQVTKN